MIITSIYKSLFIHYYICIVINSYPYIIYLMISTASSLRALSTTIRYNKIEFKKPDNPYNLRWQWKWKHAYYTYPNDGGEHTYVRKPEDAPKTRPPYYTVFQDIIYRIAPTAKMYLSRIRRLQDPFQLYVLPGTSLFFFFLWDLSFGFKVFSILPLAIFYTRLRNKTLDPDLKERFLRDMIHEHPELGQLFKPETIHVLDYDFEYDEGFPDEEKFPEFNNKVFRFFNSDTSMCTGFFKFGDLESGATMHLKVNNF